MDTLKFSVTNMLRENKPAGLNSMYSDAIVEGGDELTIENRRPPK